MKVDIRVLGEFIGLDLYCLQLIPDPNENLGVMVDPQREQHHDSELGYLSDLCSRLCCIALEYMFGLASTPDEKT